MIENNKKKTDEKGVNFFLIFCFRGAKRFGGMIFEPLPVSHCGSWLSLSHKRLGFQRILGREYQIRSPRAT
jgi:hypothetical protein